MTLRDVFSVGSAPVGRGSIILAASILGAALLWVGGEAVALRTAVSASMNALAAPPTPVAVVNLRRVLMELKDRDRWTAHINNLKNSAKDESDSRAAKLNQIDAQLKDMPDSPERDRQRDDLALQKLQLSEWQRLKQIEIDRESSLMFKKMFREVRDEAEQVAQAQGIKLVLVDDSDLDPQALAQVNAPQELQILQQLESLRVLYADRDSNGGIDITDQVIVRINNRS